MEDLLEKLSCTGCGASLEYEAGVQALKCQYCSAITTIEREEYKLDDTPKMIVPLTVEKSRLREAVNRLLTSGDYTPDDLLEKAVFTKMDRFYVPTYLYDGDFEATWTASFGYDRTEHYTSYETEYRNGRAYKTPVTKTKTVTDWRPVNGSDSGSFTVFGYAGNMLPTHVLPLVEFCAHSETVTDYKVSYVSGLDVEAYSRNDGDVYTSRAKPEVNAIIDASVKSHAQGHRQRDWHWTADISKDVISVAVPICHVKYEYEGKEYNVWADGTDASIQVSDELPQDQNRQKKVQVGFIPGGIATVAFFLAGLVSEPSALFGAMSWGTFLTVCAAWGFGFWRRHVILTHSQKVRSALLAEMTASTSNMSHVSEADGNALADSFRRPDKPWALDGTKDKRALIISSIVLAALVFALGYSGGEAAYEEEVVATEEAPVEEAPAAAPAEAAQEAAAEAPAPEVVAAEGAQEAAAEPGSEPVVADPAAATQAAEHPLVSLVSAASSNDWAAAEERMTAVKAIAAPAAGDRQASRAANAEGLAALKQDNVPAAIAAFTKAVEADATDVEARSNLAYAYIKGKDFENGTRVSLETLQLAPTRSNTWINLADALAQSGNAGAAVATLRVAVRYSDSRDKTVAFLGRIAASNPSEPFRAAAAQVVNEAPQIP